MSDISFVVTIKEENILKIEENAKKHQLTVEKYIEKLVDSTIDRIKFIDGYSFNFRNESIEYKNKVIKLTKKEYAFFKYLLDNSDRYVSLEELAKNVWKDEDTTIYTIRNIPNKIRSKTCRELIKNKSCWAYCLNIVNILNSEI